MSIKNILVASLFIVFLLFPTLVLAQNNYGADTAAQTAGLSSNKLSKMGDPATVIGTIINIVLSFVGIVFFVLILYAGFIWMTAMGSSEQVTKAKNIIEGAIIGLVLVGGAYAIANFVFTQLDSSRGGSSAVNCQGMPDNIDCGDNKVCKNNQCITECKAQKNGVCGARESCTNGTITKGLCPGGENNVCCHK